MSRRCLGKLSEPRRRPNRLRLALTGSVDDKIESQIIPTFDTLALPEDLVRRAGAATAAAPAPAPSCCRFRRILKCRSDEIREVVFRRDRQRRQRLWDYDVLRPRGAKPQFVTTERRLDVLAIKPNGYQLFEQLHGDDLPHTPRCFDRLPQFRHYGFHLPVLIVLV